MGCGDVVLRGRENVHAWRLFLFFFWSKKRRPSINVVLEPTDEYNDPRLFSVATVSLFGNGVSTYHTQYIDDVRNVCSAHCFSLVERVLAPMKLKGREERGRRKKENTSTCRLEF